MAQVIGSTTSEFYDRPAAASLDFLDDDDEVPPPPPPVEDDDEDSSSTRSSPDENYGPTAAIAPFGAQYMFPDSAPVHAAPRALVPLRFATSGDVVFECLEGEGSSGAAHLIDESDNDDAESYNGGATSTDDDEPDDEPGYLIREDSAYGAAHQEGDDGDFARASSSTPHPTYSHPFLDMEQQRRQFEWDRSQQRSAYHAHMQRSVTLEYRDRVIALRLLMHEASRFHSRLRSAAQHHPAALTKQQWEAIGDKAMADIERSGPATVQRNLSCMCVFSGSSAASDYGEHEAERMRRARKQQAVIETISTKSYLSHQ